jgi:hypothetical protein
MDARSVVDDAIPGNPSSMTAPELRNSWKWGVSDAIPLENLNSNAPPGGRRIRALSRPSGTAGYSGRRGTRTATGTANGWA